MSKQIKVEDRKEFFCMSCMQDKPINMLGDRKGSACYCTLCKSIGDKRKELSQIKDSYHEGETIEGTKTNGTVDLKRYGDAMLEIELREINKSIFEIELGEINKDIYEF